MFMSFLFAKVATLPLEPQSCHVLNAFCRHFAVHALRDEEKSMHIKDQQNAGN